MENDEKVIREVRPRGYETETDCSEFIINRKHLRKYTPAQELEVEEDAYLLMPDYTLQENNKPEGIQQERHETQPRPTTNYQQCHKEVRNTGRTAT